jgi:hypothetical protein
LTRLIGSFEDAFPGRVLGWYVEGSYADGTSIATSDIDLVAVFRGRFAHEGEREAAARLCAACARKSALELDVLVQCEDDLAGGAPPAFIWGSTCLHGEDVRNRGGVLPIETWARRRMQAAYWLTINVFNRPTPVRYPLSFPRPGEPFFGYDRRTVRLADRAEACTTRDLTRVTGWAATALLARQAGVYVARKSDCHVLYRAHLGGAWAGLLEEIYQRCRQEWRYLVPEAPRNRALLARMCRDVLGFENHFLAAYRDFVVGELESGDGAVVAEALDFLERVPFDDAGVRGALHEHARDGDGAVRQAGAEGAARSVFHAPGGNRSFGCGPKGGAESWEPAGLRAARLLAGLAG